MNVCCYDVIVIAKSRDVEPKGSRYICVDFDWLDMARVMLEIYK